MAYQYQNSQDPGVDENGQKLLSPSTTLLTQGGPSAAPPGQGGVTAYNNTPKQNQSFAGINSYLSANQGNGSTNGITNGIVGDLDTQQSALKNDINTGYNNYQSQVDAGTNKPNENLAKEAEGNALGVLNDPSKSAQFKNMLTGTYQGPTAYTPTYGEGVSNLNDKVKSLKSNSGVQSYLQNKGEGQGQASLNSALIGNDQSNYNKISNYQNDTSALADQKAVDAGNAQIAAKAQSAKTASDLRSRVSGDLANYQTQAQQDVDSQKKAISETDARIQSALKGGSAGLASLSPQDLARLGFSGNDVQNLTTNAGLIGQNNLDYAQAGGYVQNPVDNLTVANTLSDERRNQGNALASLLGQSPIFSDKSAPIDTGLKYNAGDVVNKVRSSAQDKVLQDATKQFGDDYYTNVGEQTGQGFGPTQGRRADSDVKAFVANYLKNAETPNRNQINNQWQIGNNPSAYHGAAGNLIALLDNARNKYRGIL